MIIILGAKSTMMDRIIMVPARTPASVYTFPEQSTTTRLAGDPVISK